MASAAVIFDLDDTLLDTSMLLSARDRRDWGEVLSRLGEVKAFEVDAGQVPVASLPKEARSRGYAIGVYTHSPERYASELLRAYGIRTDALITGSDRHPPKPDPTGLLAIARQLGIPPAKCVYVGDSVGDFGAAAAAGMWSIGVAWTRRTPVSWKHGWPDNAVASPSRFLQILEGTRGLGLVADETAASVSPDWHWGSIARLGAATYALGRYFPTSDRRHGQHALSRLILAAKQDSAARSRLAKAFAEFGRHMTISNSVLVASVPPAPGNNNDRFVTARASLASPLGATDGGGLLRMNYGVDGYKSIGRTARAAHCTNRFSVTTRLSGEEVVLLDDVITSGAQSAECRRVLKKAGASRVYIVAAAVSQNAVQEPCPACGEQAGGRIRVKTNSRTGQQFLGCSRWSQGCGWSQNLG